MISSFQDERKETLKKSLVLAVDCAGYELKNTSSAADEDSKPLVDSSSFIGSSWRLYLAKTWSRTVMTDGGRGN